MAASSADLNSTTLTLDAILTPVAASTTIWLNENVGVNASGYALPMAATSGLVFMGYAEQQVVNSGSAGAASVPINLIGSGVDGRLYVFDCTGATQAWVGALLYFTDDHTVSTSASNSIVAGLGTQFLSSTKVVVDVTRRSAA